MSLAIPILGLGLQAASSEAPVASRSEARPGEISAPMPSQGFASILEELQAPQGSEPTGLDASNASPDASVGAHAWAPALDPGVVGAAALAAGPREGLPEPLAASEPPDGTDTTIGAPAAPEGPEPARVSAWAGPEALVPQQAQEQPVVAAPGLLPEPVEAPAGSAEARAPGADGSGPSVLEPSALDPGAPEAVGLESAARPLPEAPTATQPTLALALEATQAEPPRLEPSAQAPAPPPPPEPPVPPAEPLWGQVDADGGVRIHLDPELAVEVRPRGDGLEVLLDGTAGALEPMQDVEQELQRQLRQAGSELTGFAQHRRSRDDGGTPRKGPAQQQHEPQPRHVAFAARGSLINTIA